MPERQARGIFGVLENRILRIAALIGAIALIVGTAAAAVRWLRDVSEGQHKVQKSTSERSDSPRPIHCRGLLGAVRAGSDGEGRCFPSISGGIRTAPLRAALRVRADHRRSRWHRGLAYGAGNRLQVPSSFRFPAPEFTLNATTIQRGIDACGGPNLSAGYCGAHKAGYFERAGGLVQRARGT